MTTEDYLNGSDTVITETNSRKWYKPKWHESDDERCTSDLTSLSSQDLNSFRFNFQQDYDVSLDVVYPKFYKRFELNGHWLIQKTGPHRSVCLLCQCELVQVMGKQNLVNHISGNRHLKYLTNQFCNRIFTNYHETFYNLSPEFQAHQVYFMPDNDHTLLKCVLCKLYVKLQEVKMHILEHPHQDNILKYAPDLEKCFNLVDQQLAVYNPNVEREVPTTNQNLEQRVTKQTFKRHEIVPSILKPDDNNFLVALPRRYRQHFVFFVWHENKTVTCIVCATTKMQKKEFYQHLNDDSHLSNTKLKRIPYVYFCEICNKKFHEEVSWQTHLDKASAQHKKSKKLEREFECITCNVIIYGTPASLSRHRFSAVLKNSRAKGISLNQETKEYFSSSRGIVEKACLLLQEAWKVSEDIQNVSLCCRDIEKALSVYFKSCKAYPFGSRTSGLGCLESDLDMFVDTGDMYSGNRMQSDHHQISILTPALRIFKSSKVFQKVISRPTARTPIIKLKHLPTGLECDISFRHGLSVENTKFLRFCFQLQPISQILFLLIKKWSHLCNLNENIRTYAFTMMGIFYLQTEKYLLSVKALKKLNPQPGVVINGWETIKYTKSLEEMKKCVKIYKGDVLDILKGFFKYYSDFDYDVDVICPLMGTVVKKKHFDLHGTKLPKEMDCYVMKINNEKEPEYFRSLSELCVQDPFDMSHNLTKACSQLVVQKLKKLCKLTYDVLNENKD